jgi:hypothetical protein
VIIEKQIPLLEEILSEWEDTIGDEFNGYKNHVYRMIHFCLALKDCYEEEKEKIIIAATFHDIGLWLKDTLDYIPPSLPPAMEYLKNRNLEAWSTEVELMITEHHKVKEYKDTNYPLVEIFRKGDLIDFSFDLFQFGVSKTYIKQVKASFSNANFHKNLGKRAAKWFLKHPLDPAPMMMC